MPGSALVHRYSGSFEQRRCGVRMGVVRCMLRLALVHAAGNAAVAQHGHARPLLLHAGQQMGLSRPRPSTWATSTWPTCCCQSCRVGGRPGLAGRLRHLSCCSAAGQSVGRFSATVCIPMLQLAVCGSCLHTTHGWPAPDSTCTAGTSLCRRHPRPHHLAGLSV